MIFATYDTDRGRLAFHSDSYQGGPRYRSPSSTTIGTAVLTRYKDRLDANGRASGEYDVQETWRTMSYLVPHPGETRQAFEVRLSLAAYVNIVAPIVDAYVDAVTGPVSRDLGPLDQYLQRLDGEEQTWGEAIEEVARQAVIYGATAMLLDTPAENPATNRAEEERLGVGLRASTIPPTAWAWVELDDDGTLSEFAFVDQPLVVEGQTQTVSLWRYTRTTWEKHALAVRSSDSIAGLRKAIAPATCLDGGSLPRPGRVPVVFAYFRRVASSRAPAGSSLIADACDLARQVYNTLSWVEEIHRKTAFPFLAIPERAAGGQLDSGTRVQVGPDTALGYSADTGVPSWVQPSAESTRELRDHALFVVGLALRTTGLEVTADQGAPSQSGVALKIRSRDFDARCVKFARGMGKFERAALTLAAEMLGLAASPSVTYPRRFVLPDAAEDLARATLLLQSFGDRLGVDGVAEATRQALDAALSLDDDQLAALVAEVKAKAALPVEQPEPAATEAP